MIAASAAAAVLLVGVQVAVLPSMRVPACPTAPSLRATTYDEAVAELRRVGSTLVPRRVEADSARRAGTLLGPPKVERIDGRCNATFSVSNGRLAVIARTQEDVRIRPDTGIAATRPRLDLGRVPPAAPSAPTAPQPCPAAPRLSALNYDAAVRELASVSRLQPRARPVAARSAGGTIVRGPVVEREGDICYATFYVSDGSLAAPRPAPQPAPQPVPQPRPTPTPQPASPPDARAQACPPLPTNLPDRVEAAISLLGRFDVRVNTLPSTLSRGQLLRPPQVQLARPRCVVTLTASDGSLTRVPRITGNSLEEARRAVESARLVLRAVDAPSDAPEGSVIAQQPGADSESRLGATVIATVARPREFPIPNMIGRRVADAERELERFRVERRVVRSTQPDGEVVEQDPLGPTRRRAGTTVVLTVSDGSLVVLPDVTRLTLDAARQSLGALGAQLQVASEARDDGAAPDTVLEQAPLAGRPVERGSTVRLTVSAGLPVPDVVGMAVDAARAQLGRFWVVTRRVEHGAPLDEVVQQSPSAGGRIAAEQTIELALSDFSLVKAPDVATLTLQDARAALAAAGLSATVQSGRDLPGARVVAQQPARDASARRGSVVGLTLEWPPLWAKVAGGLLLLGAASAGLLGLRARRAQPPKVPVHVTVRLEPRLAPVINGDPRRSGPDVTLDVRLADPRSDLHIDHGSDG